MLCMMLCYVMLLCHALLWHALSCSVVSCDAMFCHAVFCHALLRSVLTVEGEGGGILRDHRRSGGSGVRGMQGGRAGRPVRGPGGLLLKSKDPNLSGGEQLCYA